MVVLFETSVEARIILCELEELKDQETTIMFECTLFLDEAELKVVGARRKGPLRPQPSSTQLAIFAPQYTIETPGSSPRCLKTA